MSEISHLCVISPDYPSEERPYVYTFVDQLVCAIADHGIEVTVITPHDIIKTKMVKDLFWERKTPGGNIVKVFSPAAPTLTTRKIGPINISKLSLFFFMKAVERIVKQLRPTPELLYSHFLSPAGITAAMIGKKYGIPSMCAFGESSLWSVKDIGIEYARKLLQQLKAVVAVSTSNKNVLLENRLAPEEKIKVVPNAVDHNLFYPRDKQEARRILDLPQDSIIGIYTGSFTKWKGINRVQEAASSIPGLKMVYLGGGPEKPEGENILFKGRMAHDQIPLWLSAADFFVLPTLAEGCCNAVIEAMSCGLPIISSDKAFNYDILDRKSALLVDPMDVSQINLAIKRVVDDSELRLRLREASLNKSENLDINKRSDIILDFMQEVINARG